ncbi:tyrosine-type recombinase/integrase [Limosilactobacillus reuteri]|uniref:tyrosine-type recombinase/integrase n=1 Tax=Limosilactobacillus reuteri TaxID=1598 RepID=UPI001E5E490D|nr:site-specific integrase [Limosilactobacillus reuteri]
MWVEKRADDNYKFIERYKDPLTGNLRKVSIFFEKNTNSTRKKAQMALEKEIHQRLAKIQDGTIKEGITLGQVIKEWEPIYKQQVRSTTWQSYLVAKKHIEKYIGNDVQVSKITPKYLIHIYEDMLYKHGYNNPTVKSVEFKMNNILRFAFRRDYIANQPPKLLPVEWKKNKANDVGKKFLDQDELPYVLSEIEKLNPLYEQIFDWQYLTGMRIGEVLALRVKDIKKKSEIYYASVSGTLDYSANKVSEYVRQPMPKNDSSFRDVKLSSDALEIYKHRKKGKHKDDFLFQDNHQWFTFTRLNASLRKVKHDLKLDKQLTTHTFRHTHVSKLAELGMPLYIIQDRVGHKDAETTREVYLHVTQNARKKYDDLLDKL